MKVQMWWCERCGALGAVLHEDHADVMSVVYALGGQHAKTTPQCPIDATHLRVIVPENIKEPFTFTVKIEADRRSQALELQVDELRRALYAECRSLACGPECVGGGYRKCTGCDSRAKMAYGMPWEEVAEKPTCDVVIGKLPRTDRCGLDLPCPDHATEKPVREHKLNCSTYRLADLTKCDCGVKRNDEVQPDRGCHETFLTPSDALIVCDGVKGHGGNHVAVWKAIRYEWPAR